MLFNALDAWLGLELCKKRICIRMRQAIGVRHYSDAFGGAQDRMREALKQFSDVCFARCGICNVVAFVQIATFSRRHDHD
ncbi:hypothetical protein O206_05035 [Ochrobactrum sp. EGD-AQ16]|nr:hypothetical protein O206_05035 [Ochrobactrum sp. EGD-AQ16]MPR60568.1 hypothetical protein [Brucella intermedia]HCH72935.1 hypothetical protein [Ochrobactrum sp.]